MAVREVGLDGGIAIAEADPAERVALSGTQIEAERARGGEAIGHDTFAAGLIDRRHTAIGEGDLQTAAARGESGGESGGAAANDEEIGRVR